jgi:hypothetical protein
VFQSRTAGRDVYDSGYARGDAPVEVDVRGQEEGPEVFFVLERIRVEKRIRTITLD